MVTKAPVRPTARRLLVFLVPALLLAAAACGQAGTSGTPGTPSPAAPQRPAQSASPQVSSSPSASPPVTASPPAASRAPSPPAQILQPGMTGPAVTRLQQRLSALHYYPGPMDGQFGTDTLEAVWAFQEVQGLPGQDAVSPAMQQALAHPRAPAELVPGGGSTRIEVNLADETLVLYRGNRAALISHVSTGGGYYFCTSGGCGYAVTPAGNYETTVFMPGWVTVPLGEMYNPVFFIGTAYAIHGDTYVPMQPVSHGCVRIPMDVASFFFTLVPTPGTPVYIRR
jgi:L,D-transpeptidase catalytic domain/Putative peptidoglycan binding domain